MSLGPVSRSQLISLWQKMANRGVEYLLGAKAPSLTCDSSEITRIDCSGFTRYSAAKASGMKLVLPDGAENQRDFCLRMGFERADYRLAAEQANPDKLFLCYMVKEGPAGSCHAWWLHQGKTMESHGGEGPLGGVKSRPFDAWIEHHSMTLVDACSDCFLIPSVP